MKRIFIFLYLIGTTCLAQTVNFPWGVAPTYFINGSKPTFTFTNIPGTAGYVTDPNGLTSNSVNNVLPYLVVRPLATAPAVWNSSEFPVPAYASIQNSIYLYMNNYISSNFPGVPMANITDQVKVAAIIASLRDVFLNNFVAPYTSDANVGARLSAFDAGTGKMMALVYDAINQYPNPGYKLICTETSQLLAFFLNGYGIPARWWDVQYFNPTIGQQQHVHGTVEYYDQQMQKWVFVDLLYGITGVIKTSQPATSVSLTNTTQEALSLPEWVSAINNNIDYPVLYVIRNYNPPSTRWYQPISSVSIYGSGFNGNGPAPINQIFISPYSNPSNQSVTTYMTVRSP